MIQNEDVGLRLPDFIAYFRDIIIEAIYYSIRIRIDTSELNLRAHNLIATFKNKVLRQFSLVEIILATNTWGTNVNPRTKEYGSG